jgi:3-deoxy-D-manno-octulosonic acid (KDO) 8-phosphate synthase
MKNRFEIWSAGHGRYFCYVEDRKMKNKIEKTNKCNLTAYYMTKSGKVFGWQFLIPDVETRDYIQQIK